MRRISLISFCIALFLQLSAQYNEIGVQIGLSNYVGDLSEYKLKSDGYGSLIGVFGRRNFTKHLSGKVSFLKGEISGDDQFAKSLSIQERNLNFRSNVLELSVTGEYNLSPYNIRAKQTGVPYVFTGLAFTHFNPQAQMRGSWYDLQPLETEGVSYNRYIIAVPFGLGMKFNISYKVNFSLEFGARKTFTDYLDDVSSDYLDVYALRQTDPMVAALSYRTPEVTGSFSENPVGSARGNADNNDWYFFGGLVFSVNLTDKYGLDFDKKYDIFKDHLKKPQKEEREAAIKKEKETIAQSSKKKRTKKGLRLFKKKKYMTPYIKKKVSKH